ncbi:MAG: hypothetical protein GY868_08090 [Deltaproteobacteria bacterium]|nr:hypothetical protein [Deltaproteobacteria bacterium]
MNIFAEQNNEALQQKKFSIRSFSDRRSGNERRRPQGSNQPYTEPERRATADDRRGQQERRAS